VTHTGYSGVYSGSYSGSLPGFVSIVGVKQQKEYSIPNGTRTPALRAIAFHLYL
jgi:hypothetical protein